MTWISRPVLIIIVKYYKFNRLYNLLSIFSINFLFFHLKNEKKIELKS